ncbi:MAG TPA: heme-binding protein [Ilumatobacter sp.]|nr:heme-binding protein [Ilumatobacter sp.]
MKLTLETARTVIAETFKAAAADGLKPLAVIVLDSAGLPVAYERQDGSSNLRYPIAHGKAYGALGFGVGSRALAGMAQANPAFVAGATAAFGGALIPAPGGVLIDDPDGGYLGAIGVSGDTADNDEKAAVAGATAAGLTVTTG